MASVLSPLKVSASSKAAMSMGLRPMVSMKVQEAKVSEKPSVSVGRAAIIGGIASVAGGIAGHFSKLGAPAGAAIGLGAGAGGSVIQNLVSSPKTVSADVQGTDQVEMHMIALPDMKSANPMYQNMRVVMPILTTEFTGEPAGWYGAVVQHGIKCQLEQMKYVQDHVKYENPGQIMPHMGINEAYCTAFHERVFCNNAAWGNCYKSICYGPPPDDETNFSNSTLFTQRYIEWPTPAWSTFRLNPGKLINNGSLLGHAAHEYCLRHANKNRSKGQGFSLAKLVSYMPQYTEIMKTPEYWKANVQEFQERLEAYYGIGQWIVWAGEMMRLHSRTPDKVEDSSAIYSSAAWRKHCLLWGVGCADSWRIRNRTNMLDIKTKNTFTKNGRPYLHTGMNHDQIKSYLDLIMKHTPPPGTPGYNGLQIAAHGAPRRLIDMPKKAGSMVPPWEINQQDWLLGMRARMRNKGSSPGLKVFMKVIGIVGGLFSSFTGGAAGAATSAIGNTVVQTASGTIMSVVTETILAGGYLSTRDLLGWDDIVSLVGDLLTAAASDLDLDIGDAGNIFGEGSEKWATIAEDLRMSDVYQEAMNTYSTLKETYNWNYCDQAFGTLHNAAEDVKSQLTK